MTVLRQLPLEDHVYLATWSDRRPGETVPQVVNRVLRCHYYPTPSPVPRAVPSTPLLSFVEVIDRDPA